jgi:hypothetical protein
VLLAGVPGSWVVLLVVLVELMTVVVAAVAEG